MEKKHNIIVSLGSVLAVLFFLFFLGACGQKEETPKKTNVVRKKVVSKKIKKPAPKTEKKAKTDTAAKSKDAKDEKGVSPSKKTPEKSKPPETDTAEKKKVSTTTLAAKKKPAFKPKSEISQESDYKSKQDSAVKVAKKDDVKAADLSEKQQAAKKGLEKEDKEKTPESKKDIEKPKPGKGPDTDSKEAADKAKDEKSKESAEKKEDASEEGKDTEDNKQIAGLEPSTALAPVKIDPLSQNYKYTPEGKIDPFSSLFQVKSEKKKKPKRFPLTPLEQKDISQFKLVGVILSAKGNKAIVQGAGGKGYVISKGTYIGINDGRVVKILKDRVICEEEVENLFGQIEIKARTLKLQKPPGAL